MSPSEQERTCVPTAPVIEQCEPGSESMAHTTPVSEGSGSFTVTLVAVAGPPLFTTIVNPTELPALTGVRSAVLTMEMLGSNGGGAVRVHPLCTTTIVALASTVPSLVADALAVALCHLQTEQARRRFGLPGPNMLAKPRGRSAAAGPAN